jgi:hypothetical protein
VRRQLFTLASALSLLLCVATVVLWVRSFWFSEQWSSDVTPPGNIKASTLIFASGVGRIALIWQVLPPDSHSTDPSSFGYFRTNNLYIPEFPQAGPTTPQQREWRAWVPGVSLYSIDPLMVSKPQRAVERRSFGPQPPDVPTNPVATVKVVGSQGGRSLILSCWLLTIIFAITPSAWLLDRRRRRRRYTNRPCLACGYDLTGNVSGVCPECGDPIPSSIPITETDSV